jgi:ADP-ribose pyrophosphatase YjhB (NUDIX family)
MTPDYDKIGLLAIRDNRILLCRKRHTTSLLILPGGCLEPGETAAQCLSRELREELGEVRLEQVEYVGTYTDRAAGESHKTVRIELYRAELIGDVSPHSEIKELVWFAGNADPAQLAPSLRNQILPDLIHRGILLWPECLRGS